MTYRWRGQPRNNRGDDVGLTGRPCLRVPAVAAGSTTPAPSAAREQENSMATRKPVEDLTARDRAEQMVEETGAVAEDASPVALKPFATAEFETAQSKVGGEEVRLRRVVLTGPWEVVSQ